MMSQALAIIGIIISASYVLIVPGLALSFAFFRRHEIDVIERIGVSLALSVSVVPLIVFYLNLIGVKITQVNVVIEIGSLTAAAIVVAVWRAKRVTPTTESELKDKSAQIPPKPQPQPRRRRM